MKHFFALSLMVSIAIRAFSQEENAAICQGKKYLEINIQQLSTFNKKSERLQFHLLKRVKRKEHKFSKRLQRIDSASYVRYKEQTLDFDSISHIGRESVHGPSVKVPKIDSLKAINEFLSNKATVMPNSDVSFTKYTDQIGEQKSQFINNQQVSNLINQRLIFLKSLKGNQINNIKGLIDIDKQVFYTKSKVETLRVVSDDPTRMEEKALEYLKGENGFDKYLESANGNDASILSSKSIEELESMGYQTKRQLNTQLQTKLGSGGANIQQNLSVQINDYTDKLNKLKDVQNKASQTKESIIQLKYTDKPAFKVNPMRGKPFAQRLEKQFNWQANRASLQGRPATLQLSAMAGFKQTVRLSYGLGLALVTGLGQNWSDVKISFQGLGLRSYTAWQWRYGLGIYAGYERTYKQFAFTEKPQVAISEYNTRNTINYSDAVLVGLTKRYHINEKSQGSIQLLYDIWWQEKALKSPVQIRLSILK